jgi:hypothetical protein
MWSFKLVLTRFSLFCWTAGVCVDHDTLCLNEYLKSFGDFRDWSIRKGALHVRFVLYNLKAILNSSECKSRTKRRRRYHIPTF